MSVEIIETLLIILILAAPCSYTSLKLKASDNKFKWHVIGLGLTTTLFFLFILKGSGQLHFQQMFIIGIPTLLVMLFSTSLVRSESEN